MPTLCTRLQVLVAKSIRIAPTDNRNLTPVDQAMVKAKALVMAKSVKARAMVAVTRERLRATMQNQRLPLNMDLAALRARMSERNLAWPPDTAALTIRDMPRALTVDPRPPKTPTAGMTAMIRRAMADKTRALGTNSKIPALASGKKTLALVTVTNRKTKVQHMAANLQTALLITVEQTKIDPSTNSNKPTGLAEIMTARLPMADRRNIQATVKSKASRADMAEDMDLGTKTTTNLAKSMVMDEIEPSEAFERIGYLWTNRYEKAVE